MTVSPISPASYSRPTNNNNPSSAGADNTLSDSETSQTNKDTNTGETSKTSLDKNQQPTNEDKKILDQLKARDREVRAHEQAHLAAAGRYATSGAAFTYERGQDGVYYAVGGEVSIDTSPVPNDPEATLEKAQIIQRAALAPAQPSAQDRAVAAEAAQMTTQARAELLAQTNEKNRPQAEKSDISAYEKIAAFNEDMPTKTLVGTA